VSEPSPEAQRARAAPRTPPEAPGAPPASSAASGTPRKPAPAARAPTARAAETRPDSALEPVVEPAEIARVERFLYQEALLLDQGRLRDWLALFDAGATYWVPLVASATTPDDQLNLVYDDYALLEERVFRLETGVAYSQDPPSRTLRGLSSVLVDRAADGLLVARSVSTLHESRPNASHHYVGRYTHHLADTTDGLRIRHKRIDLAGADGYLPPLSFLL
jgi:3-phenylpropionate/cinnamic acid dioxygenase small subunit